MPATQVADFSAHLYTHRNRAYTWGLWAAADLLRGGCSDGAFADFRAWLVFKGPEVYEAALANPDTLADHVGPEGYGDEGLAVVAGEVYEELTGEDAWEAASAVPVERQGANPRGEEWEEGDLHALVSRLPRLAGVLGIPHACAEAAPAEPPSVEKSVLSIGDRVAHPEYGEGQLLFLRAGFPKARVRFADETRKVLVDQLTW